MHILPPKQYFAGLYRIPTAAVALIRNTSDEFLVLKRSYAPGYGVPGGMVEEHESPRDASIRETFEETGLIVKPGALCAVAHYDSDNAEYKNEQITFIFDAGVIDDAQIAKIRLSEEHTEFSFIAPEAADQYFGIEAADRFRRFAEACRSSTCIYLDHQELPK